MNKKNRFSMLEVGQEPEASSKNTETKVDSCNPENIKKPIKEMKVIIANSEFEANLNKHKHHEQVKDQVKAIHLKKKVIESKILNIKKKAWLKILLGIFIILVVVKEYIWEQSTIKNLGNNEAELIITKYDLNSNSILLIILIIIFIYVAFFYEKNKDKK